MKDHTSGGFSISLGQSTTSEDLDKPSRSIHQRRSRHIIRGNQPVEVTAWQTGCDFASLLEIFSTLQVLVTLQST
jgi:hypothetical protein